jgi:hypothetical protein
LLSDAGGHDPARFVDDTNLGTLAMAAQVDELAARKKRQRVAARLTASFAEHEERKRAGARSRPQGPRQRELAKLMSTAVCFLVPTTKNSHADQDQNDHKLRSVEPEPEKNEPARIIVPDKTIFVTQLTEIGRKGRIAQKRFEMFSIGAMQTARVISQRPRQLARRRESRPRSIRRRGSVRARAPGHQAGEDPSPPDLVLIAGGAR